jgi:hypothetical protein
MNFTAEELQQNYQKFLGYIDQYIGGDRKAKLLKFYQDHAERIMLMPAASVDHHHNTFPGGYVDHVMRVMDCPLKVKELWAATGATINYTDEELIFAAMNHDLGKIGTEEAEQYQPNDSEWHRKNQGKIYKHNPENPFMTVPDRSIFLLQARGIKISFNEYLGIKLHDGLYEDANKPYYISHAKESKLRTNLPIVLHHADHMAARIEFEMWDRNEGSTQKQPVKEKRTKPSIPTDMSNDQKEDLLNVFNNLFK